MWINEKIKVHDLCYSTEMGLVFWLQLRSNYNIGALCEEKQKVGLDFWSVLCDTI